MAEGYPATQSPVDDVAAAQTAQAEASQPAAAVGNLKLGDISCYPEDLPSAQYRYSSPGLTLEQSRGVRQEVLKGQRPEFDRRYDVPGFGGAINVEFLPPNGTVTEGTVVYANDSPEAASAVLDESPEIEDGFRALLGSELYAWQTCRAVARQKGLKILGYDREFQGQTLHNDHEWAVDSSEFSSVDGSTKYRDPKTGEIMTYDTPKSRFEKDGDRSLLDRIGTFVISEEGVLSWVDQDGNVKMTGASPEEVEKLEALGFTAGEWQPPFTEGEEPVDGVVARELRGAIILGMKKRGETLTPEQHREFIKKHGYGHSWQPAEAQALTSLVKLN